MATSVNWVYHVTPTVERDFIVFAATLSSPTSLEGEGEVRGVQLVAICNLTTRSHYTQDSGPLKVLKFKPKHLQILKSRVYLKLIFYFFPSYNSLYLRQCQLIFAIPLCEYIHGLRLSLNDLML